MIQPTSTKNQSKESAINTIIIESKCDTNKISDGYHNFGQLYDHRIELFIKLAWTYHHFVGDAVVWRSQRNSEGNITEGWFIMGIGTEPGKQITYHLPMDKWDDCMFAEVIEKAIYDGHTSEDVLERIKTL